MVAPWQKGSAPCVNDTARERKLKAMSKHALTKAIARERKLKVNKCSRVMDTLAAIGAKEVKKIGYFRIPGLCNIKTRVKSATKGGVRMVFGKETEVKEKPARRVVQVRPCRALKLAVSSEEHLP